ncbi:MAG: succinate dehydrogenase [Planctomycetes bacterium]|nr:succinate dehydrogenase [Planctomycetota bacterium]NOG54021.1 succinylglutamate desuccinylase/aspartoacylase family protein [Planctomycetota bacterium]
MSETYTGDEIWVPVRVHRARKAGPRVFLTAAIHGDEINGLGIIREAMLRLGPELKAGTLICVPVVNMFGFEAGQRYTPDRRDLNRMFPGSPNGSLANRVANILFDEVVRKCDYGIDLHSAAEGRTNFPNVRGDLNVPGVRTLAESFGCELIVHGRGPEGSLRYAACQAGCPTIILEAGEVAKIEPTVLQVGLRGIRNVLVQLGMMRGTVHRPAYQTRVQKKTWVRAAVGGLLRFHVAPGDLVEAGQPLATNESLFGDARSVLIAPSDAIVLGMATMPAVKPGEPVCHLAVPRKSLRSIRKALDAAADESIPHQLRRDMASQVTSVEYGHPDPD